uniref:Uncharacterized protein n=1 Tax=Helianthus annuus TaxID=4232 RepID=A0A251V9K4_HELAN
MWLGPMFLLLCSSRTIWPLNHLWRNMIAIDDLRYIEGNSFRPGVNPIGIHKVL